MHKVVANEKFRSRKGTINGTRAAIKLPVGGY